MKKIVLILPIVLFLIGCEPTVFGVPQSTWNTLTPAQKQQVIDNYNQRKMVDAIQGVVDSAGRIINQSQE